MSIVIQSRNFQYFVGCLCIGEFVSSSPFRFSVANNRLIDIHFKLTFVLSELQKLVALLQRMV